MSKPLWYRWARVYFAGGCIIGTGALLYRYTTPTDDQLISAFSPEVRAEYEAARELRRLEQAEVMRIAKQTSSSNDPIWKTGAIGSPFDLLERNPNQKLVDYEAYKMKKAEDQLKDDVDAATREMNELEELKKKKRWFSWR